MNNHTKIQHYIPRMILSKWSENGKIIVYDRESDLISEGDIRNNVGAEDYFYEFIKIDSLEQSAASTSAINIIEKKLSVVENEMSRILKRLDSLKEGEKIIFTRKELFIIKYFKSLSFQRSPLKIKKMMSPEKLVDSSYLMKYGNLSKTEIKFRFLKELDDYLNIAVKDGKININSEKLKNHSTTEWDNLVNTFIKVIHSGENYFALSDSNSTGIIIPYMSHFGKTGHASHTFMPINPKIAICFVSAPMFDKGNILYNNPIYSHIRSEFDYLHKKADNPFSLDDSINEKNNLVNYKNLNGWIKSGEKIPGLKLHNDDKFKYRILKIKKDQVSLINRFLLNESFKEIYGVDNDKMRVVVDNWKENTPNSI